VKKSLKEPQQILYGKPVRREGCRKYRHQKERKKDGEYATGRFTAMSH